jgi:hypothetical protein
LKGINLINKSKGVGTNLQEYCSEKFGLRIFGDIKPIFLLELRWESKTSRTPEEK